ncbi:CRAL/TRIO domain-containing protein [Cryptosporidium felis]|nr:CRAL/TRIO domain-containing protein [Cryptosporidium felis]
MIVKCEMADCQSDPISDFSSKELLEVGDLNTKTNDSPENSHSEYPEIFMHLSNTPPNWDLLLYEKFLDLCRESIQTVYEQKSCQIQNETVENCFKAMLTPLRLLRFLVGFNFNLNNAFNAFNKHIKWRREFNMDSVVRPFVITNMVPNNNIEMAPLHNIITRYYPCNLLLRESTCEKTPLKDFAGNIICIERFGLLDETRLLGAVKVEELLLWYSYHMEYRSILLDNLSYESKSLVRATCIIDLFGLSVSQVHSSHMITILRRMIQLASDNYPEGMSYVVFVNAPKFFSIVWNSFKSLLAARTVEKILVLDEDYKSKLVEIVPIGNLPQFLGGLTTDQFSTVPNTGTLLLDCFGLGDDRQTLHVKRMKKEKVSISVSKPNTRVYWTWGVLEGEISFGAKFYTDGIPTGSPSPSKEGSSDKSNAGFSHLDGKIELPADFETRNHSSSRARLGVRDLETADNFSDSKSNLNAIPGSATKKPSFKTSSPISSIQNLLTQEIVLVPTSKFDSTKAYGGSYFSESPGYLVLQWDNSWSFFSGKTVHFVIKTSNPAPEELHCDSQAENSLETQINELQEIGNLVSHNVALTTITKKRPSKSHKSFEKRKNISKNPRSPRSPLQIVTADHSSQKEGRHLPHFRGRSKSAKRTSGSAEKPKEKRRSRFESGDKARHCGFSNRSEESQTLEALRRPDDASNLQSPRDFDCISDCQTNSSFVTAYSAMDEVLDIFEHKNALINFTLRKNLDGEENRRFAYRSQGLQAKPATTEGGGGKAEMNPGFPIDSSESSGSEGPSSAPDIEELENGNQDDNSENSSQISVSDGFECDLIVNSLSSGRSSGTESSDKPPTENPRKPKNHGVSHCRVSLETKINIFGFEDSQLSNRRREELEKYIESDFHPPRQSFCLDNGASEPAPRQNFKLLRDKFSRLFAPCRGKRSETEKYHYLDDKNHAVCTGNTKAPLLARLKNKLKRNGQ